MRMILLTSLFLMTTITWAAEKTQYHILEGKFHKGGVASVEVEGEDPNKYDVKISYELYKRMLVPIPSQMLMGKTLISLPPEFSDERGYLELETKKSMNVDGAILLFLGRVKWNQFEDAYKISYTPAHKKAKIDIIYHPSLPGVGWATAEVTVLNSFPLLKNYRVYIELNEL